MDFDEYLRRALENYFDGDDVKVQKVMEYVNKVTEEFDKR